MSSNHAKIGEIKTKLKEALHNHLMEEGHSIELEKVSAPIIVITKDRRVIELARNDIIYSELDTKIFNLAAVEREVYEGQDIHELCPVEIVIMQPKRSYFIFNEQKPITMSRMLLLHKSLSER